MKGGRKEKKRGFECVCMNYELCIMNELLPHQNDNYINKLNFQYILYINNKNEYNMSFDFHKLSMGVVSSCSFDPSSTVIDYAFVFLLPSGVCEDEIIDHCVSISDNVLHFIVTGANKASGTNGGNHMKNRLIDALRKSSKMTDVSTIPYVYEQGHINTLFESNSLASFVKGILSEEMTEKDRLLGEYYKKIRIGLVAQSYHALRAYMTASSSLRSMWNNVTIFPLTCKPLSWSTIVVHSQGIDCGTKWDILDGEIERIYKYQEKGDILPTLEIVRKFKEDHCCSS